MITSKTDEIHAKVDETVTAAMANHAIEIYNNGNLKTPRSETQLRLVFLLLPANLPEGGGQNLERRNVKRPKFRNCKY